ncbi:MAG: methyltransferase family protein [Beutenbergiaceae bacterium]
MKPYPPILFGSGLLLALAGHLVWPLPLPSWLWLRAVGGGLIIAAGLLALATERQFHRAHTPVLPFKDATTLITSGPLRYSRNPIYLAFAVITVGMALLTASWWPLIPLPVVLLAISGIIRGEEERLRRIFGTEYEEYCQRTRRWL